MTPFPMTINLTFQTPAEFTAFLQTNVFIAAPVQPIEAPVAPAEPTEPVAPVEPPLAENPPPPAPVE